MSVLVKFNGLAKVSGTVLVEGTDEVFQSVDRAAALFPLLNWEVEVGTIKDVTHESAVVNEEEYKMQVALKEALLTVKEVIEGSESELSAKDNEKLRSLFDRHSMALDLDRALRLEAEPFLAHAPVGSFYSSPPESDATQKEGEEE